MCGGVKAADEHLSEGFLVGGVLDRFPTAQALAQRVGQVLGPAVVAHTTTPGAQTHTDVAPAAEGQVHRDASCWGNHSNRKRQHLRLARRWTEEESIPEHVTMATVFLWSEGILVLSQANREVLFFEQS